MADITSRRITAILLKKKVEDLFVKVAPLRMLSCVWNVSDTDSELPSEGEVAAVLNEFSTLAIPALNVRSALADVAASPEGENYPLPNPPACGSSASGFFDGTTDFDGTTTFEG